MTHIGVCSVMTESTLRTSGRPSSVVAEAAGTPTKSDASSVATNAATMARDRGRESTGQTYARRALDRHGAWRFPRQIPRFDYAPSGRGQAVNHRSGLVTDRAPWSGVTDGRS